MLQHLRRKLALPQSLLLSSQRNLGLAAWWPQKRTRHSQCLSKGSLLPQSKQTWFTLFCLWVEQFQPTASTTDSAVHVTLGDRGQGEEGKGGSFPQTSAYDSSFRWLDTSYLQWFFLKRTEHSQPWDLFRCYNTFCPERDVNWKKHVLSQ